MKNALVLLNLGTPDAPRAPEVRRYLRQFLMDPYVIDIPGVLRWLLVHGIILRFRPKKSAEAYQKIWTDRGSPLLFHLLDLVDGVQKELDQTEPGQWVVIPAMRYGSPSIDSALQKVKNLGITEVKVAPLYPQYSLAATQSSVAETQEAVKRVAPELQVQFLPAFYNQKLFIDAFVEVAREDLASYAFDHILFSFHGLPERQVKKTDLTGTHCLASEGCCERITQANQNCYRAQCFATARAMAQELGLKSEQYSVCFQSRLGRDPWIKPYTDQLYQDLPKKGVKRVAVICPAFVSDCLETLEEIRIRGREDFLHHGGEDLRLVGSLNARPGWARALTRIVLNSGAWA